MENNQEEEKILSMKIFRGLICCCYLFWSFVLAAALCNQVEKVFHDPLHFPSAHASVTVSVKNPKKKLTLSFARGIILPITNMVLKDHEELDLVQLCETQMFKFVMYGNIVFDTLEQSSFQKYATC